VVVGALDEDKLPMYVVINRTGVVEFTTENTPVYKDWLTHFSPVVEKETPQTSLNFSFTN
jgi:hypothetical protein